MSENDFGELRSLLDGKQDKAHFGRIYKRVEEAALDELEQAKQDIIPYAQEKLEGWPAKFRRVDEETALRLIGHRAKVRSALLKLVDPAHFIEDTVKAISKRDADKLIEQHRLTDALEGALLGGPEPRRGYFAHYLRKNDVDFIADGSQQVEWELEDWFQRAGWVEYEMEQARLKAYEKAKAIYKDAVLGRLDDRQEEIEEEISERVWG